MQKLSFIPRLFLMALLFATFSCNDEPEVIPEPTAAFTFAADEANPLMVSFTNSSTNYESVSWDFGDGSTASTENAPTHTYTQAGDYTVVLTVTGAGGTAKGTQTVSVEAPAAEVPVAGFTFAADEADPLTVAFTNSSAHYESASWDFGDGSTVSTENAPTHTYTEAGDYTVVLTVTGAGGTDELSQVVKVEEAETTEPAEAVMLIDFENEDTAFEAWGGNTFEVVDNPDESGINTSTRVAKVVHGSDEWAGVWTALAEPLDFSNHKKLAIKVMAPVTGKLLFKIEHPTDNQIKVEQWFDVEAANEWVEIVWDLSEVEGIDAETFQKIVLFPGVETTTQETYYFDDISMLPAGE